MMLTAIGFAVGLVVTIGVLVVIDRSGFFGPRF